MEAIFFSGMGETMSERKIWFSVSDYGIENRGHDGQYRTYQTLRRTYPNEWFNNFPDAKAELIRRRAAKYTQAEQALERAKAELEKARATELPPPRPTT